MAQFGKDLDNFSSSSSIKVPSTETVENYTVYLIEVTLGPYKWTVKHRYSDFHDLHEKLCSSSKIDRNLLPPKKLFGNQSENFIKKRQHDLEVYLQTILYCLASKIPNCLAAFLDFQFYEIHGITQVMAEELYNRGDMILQTNQTYKTSPLYLYALTERLKLPEPTCDSGDVKRDIGHILDFITRLKCLQVHGGQTVGTSNIDMNQLPFDLTLFKSLQKLEILSCDIGLIGGLDTIKQTVKTLTINRSLKSIKEVLLQDLPHWKAEDGTLLVSYWDFITRVDFSHNSITVIDDSVDILDFFLCHVLKYELLHDISNNFTCACCLIVEQLGQPHSKLRMFIDHLQKQLGQLMPRVTELNLSYNNIGVIENLQWLSHMTHLDLSHNSIEQLDSLHSKLGNLKTLNLAGNKLESLQGLSKLFSLENLDLSYNNVKQVDDMKAVCSLPCVENLLLEGNPVTITLDYRTKTLAMFGDRVSELTLDKEKASQKELDTVAVLQAIQKSKDKAKEISVKKVSSNTSLTDMSSPSTSLPRYHGNSQSSGNQGKEKAPLLQKYNLFKHEDVTPTRAKVLAAYGSAQSYTYLDRKSTEGSLHYNSSLSQQETSTSSLQSSCTSHQPFSSSTVVSGQHSGHRRTSSTFSTDSYFNQPFSTLLVNISSLPDHHDGPFCTWLHSRLFGADEQSAGEQFTYILWCPVIQYRDPASVILCCVVLTERRIFILQLRNAESSYENVPEMDTFYILQLCNIQAVVIGLCYSYVRIEESFVGDSGTFAILFSSLDVGKGFCDDLQSSCTNHPENGTLDFVDLSQRCDLSKQVFEVEEELGDSSGRIAFACHGHVAESNSLMYLVLSENQVYVFKSDVLFWPKPTFDSNTLETERQFDIAEQFSIDCKIGDINTTKKVEENKEIKAKFPPVTPTSNITYKKYPLSMVFHELLGAHKLEFWFLSSKNRDAFLDRLSNLRSEHAHRMSPTTREEPEGGNVSSDSSDDSEKANDKPVNDKVDTDNSKTSKEDSDIEVLNDEEKQEESDTVSLTLEDQIKPVRKVRSKTEGVIMRSKQDSESGSKDLPSYTWHYLSPELIKHLESSVKDYHLFQPLSEKLLALTEMDGEKLAQFFHNNIVPVGSEGEELHCVFWTNVIPYTLPTEEIVTCVMLSNKAIYFISDRLIKLKTTGRPSYMTHGRHVSDSFMNFTSKILDKHHSSGILCSSEHDGGLVKPYCIMEFSDICQIHVGLFDQCVRLTGTKPETVFTLATRNSETTNMFLKNFSTMLSLSIASPMLEKSSHELELDFYKAGRTKTTIEGMEYVHPSRVKFLYPGEETVTDLLYIINEHLKERKLRVGRENILQYILGFKTVSVSQLPAAFTLEAVSIILTNEFLCLVKEDLVSYPLPDFVRGLPSTPRQKVVEVKKIEYLKYIRQSATSERDITLVFSDEKEDIVLVSDHYSLDKNKGRETPPEITVRLCVQSDREVKKFVMLLQSQWKEQRHDEDLELMVVQQ